VGARTRQEELARARARSRNYERFGVDAHARRRRCRADLHALVERWAKRKNAAPAQIALAWLMAQRPWIVPIPGTTQMPHLLENLGATRVQFTPSELADLNAAASSIQIQGARLPDGVLVLSELEAPPKK
jgi:aryl-alcohol dehydrogenase-like predicted oxidoreductase